MCYFKARYSKSEDINFLNLNCYEKGKKNYQKPLVSPQNRLG
jgi:hypothetical protein